MDFTDDSSIFFSEWIVFDFSLYKCSNNLTLMTIGFLRSGKIKKKTNFHHQNLFCALLILLIFIPIIIVFKLIYFNIQTFFIHLNKLSLNKI